MFLKIHVDFAENYICIMLTGTKYYIIFEKKAKSIFQQLVILCLII